MILYNDKRAAWLWREFQVANQFLIVVAGGTGSAGGGNPFKDPRSLLIFVIGKTNSGLDLFL